MARLPCKAAQTAGPVHGGSPCTVKIEQETPLPGFLRFLSAVAFLAAAVGIVPAHGQTYPSRPIRIIVPYPPGGGVDNVARQLTEAVSARLGQPVIIENRPGGNTFIGMSACAKAPPDGYTLCVMNADGLAFGPYVFNRIPYDPLKDLVGISKLGASPNGLFISGQLPFNNFQEVIAYARANPGKLNFGSFGTGTVGHLYTEFYRRQLNADMTHVPYRGSAALVPALISNEIQIAWVALSLVQQHVKTGRIKAIAIDDAARSPVLPDVPTLGELNARSNIETYIGVYAPAKTPAAFLERLNAAFTSALREPRVHDKLSAMFYVTMPTTLEQIETARHQEADFARRFTQSISLKSSDLPE
jgi:tripartite-type tricarboxylate transporter receptor subunit TctC